MLSLRAEYTPPPPALRLPPAIRTRFIIWHRVLNLRDHLARWAADCWHQRRLVRAGRFHRNLACDCCGSRFHTFSSRNWCRHCFTRWPDWHRTRGYGYPTRLEVWRGADNACGDCGGRFGIHHYGCGTVD